MRSRVGCARRAIGATVCVALVIAAAPPVAAAPTRWLLPVDGPIARPFRAPVGQFAAGHRGVDLVAAPGTAVRAANDGVVVFAGPVADALHVVVAHDGGIRTSSSFLARVDVRVGQRVSRGTVIGAAGGEGDGHRAGVLHLGVRVGERYIDPMLLFGEVDLTEVVRLVPVRAGEVADATTSAAERAAIAEEFLHAWDDEGCAGALGEIGFAGIGDLFNGACDGLVSIAEAGLDTMRWIGGRAAAVAEAIADLVVDVAIVIAETGATILEAVRMVAHPFLVVLEAAVKAVLEWGVAALEWLTSCPQPDAKRRGKGSGNLAFVVGGQSSWLRRRPDGTLASSVHVDRPVLGYRRDDISYFSYDPHSPTYSADDTFGDLRAQAASLARQLRALESKHPGRAVDLLGHSQGGVVIALFLAEHYRGHEDEYPRIPNVVTFASPLEGTPWATVVSSIDDTFVGHAGIGLVREFWDDAPIGTPALDQLAEDSSVVRQIGAEPPSPRVRFLSIVGSTDLVVPSPSGDLPGARKIVVSVGRALDPRDDHSGILRDDDALSAAQAHLAGGTPSTFCGPLTDVAGEKLSEAIRLGALAADALEPTQPFDGLP